MINFLPALYEDELLYSVIARYQRTCGMVSKLALHKDLYGKRMASTSVFFPKHIDAFVSNLPSTSKITTEEIIINHTLFPFYSAFLSENKANLIASKMATEHGSPIESSFGIVGSKIKIGNYLRYCPSCFKEDYEILGESYWRRKHQIVGALYCIKHRVLLKDSLALNNGNKLGYICADKDVCTTDIKSDPYSSTIKKLNLIYIRNAEYLLIGDYQRKEHSLIINTYIDLLREQGCASKSGFLYLNEIQNRFLDYYPNEYLELMQSSVDTTKAKNWLRLFVRNDNANKSPLRHLLYLQFWGITIEEFFKIDSAVGRKSVKRNYTPQFDIKERRVQWLDLIEKNKGASRSQLKELGKGLHTWIYRYDKDWYEAVTPKPKPIKPRKSNVNWKKRDKEYLEMAKEAVNYLLESPGKPIRITPSSITRVIGKNSGFRRSKNLIETRKFLEEVKEDLNDFRTRKIKWAIKEMCKQGENVTPYKVQVYAGFGMKRIEKVRDLIEKELEYLDTSIIHYKYEGKWYDRAIPNEQSENASAIDWDKRDLEYIKLAKKAYESMLNEKGKPTRITTSSILQTMGVNRWLFKPEMMKKTNEYLQEVTEEINEFRIRKIRWAIEEMRKEKLVVTPYKVQIYAGFGGGSQKIKRMIKKELDKYP